VSYKRKCRKGGRISSLDELARQEIVYWNHKPTAKGWFLSWQFRMAYNAVMEKGVIFYALPEGITTRFSDDEIIRAERRLHTTPTLEGRTELIRILNSYDNGGSVDDAIDRYETGPAAKERIVAERIGCGYCKNFHSEDVVGRGWCERHNSQVMCFDAPCEVYAP